MKGPNSPYALANDSLPQTPGTPYTDHFLQAKDQAPISAFVQRTMSVTQEQWDQIMDAPQGRSRVQHNYAYGSATMGNRKLDHLASLPPTGRTRWKYSSIFWLPVISPYNRYYHVWSTLVLLVDLSYTAFVVPIGVGFSISDTRLTWAAVCDFAAGAVFGVDLFLGFQVGFVVTYNLRKKAIMDGRLIARYYIRKGTFLVDAISTIAWLAQIIVVILVAQGRGKGKVSDILQILRLLRVSRLTRLMKRMFINSIGTNEISHLPIIKRLSSGSTYLLQILYGVMVLINFLGCLWYWTAATQGFDGTWIAIYSPFVREYGDADGVVNNQTVQDHIPQLRLYLTSIYWAMTTISTVGYGDITPQTVPEICVTLIVFFVGIMFFGILLGSIGEMLQRASKDARRAQIYREKMEAVDAWVAKRKIPKRIRHKIRAYYAEVWVRQAEESNEGQFFSELPHTLRNEVVWHMCRKLFASLYLFRDLDAPTQLLLASKMQPVRVGAGHDVCNQGDVADRLWVLQEGQLLALYYDQEAEIEVDPAIVGETALLQEHQDTFQLRICGYRTLTSCTLWEISMRDLLPILHHRPQLYAHFLGKVKEHLLGRCALHPDTWLPEFVSILQGIPDAPGLDERQVPGSPTAALHAVRQSHLSSLSSLGVGHGMRERAPTDDQSRGLPDRPKLEPMKGAEPGSEAHMSVRIQDSDQDVGVQGIRSTIGEEAGSTDLDQGGEHEEQGGPSLSRQTSLGAARSWISRRLSRSTSSRSVSFKPENEVLGEGSSHPKQLHSRHSSAGFVPVTLAALRPMPAPRSDPTRSGSGGLLQRARSGASQVESRAPSSLGPGGSSGRATPHNIFSESDSDEEDDAASKLISQLSDPNRLHAALMPQLLVPSLPRPPDPAAAQMMTELMLAMRTLQDQMQELMRSKSASPTAQ
ncbi:hypothetical protein WJX72_010205 [[Myrmecia] bisecta]|uniref:Cyclic nucleotide-binding domain-containing protein n=1 Tax=[Myrmecia] bisecta TaxID=41462 RepID=A0AAW1PH05_9CHLO